MRKILAVWAAKLSAVAGRVIGKKSSSGPGTIALKICPDIIERLAENITEKILEEPINYETSITALKKIIEKDIF